MIEKVINFGSIFDNFWKHFGRLLLSFFEHYIGSVSRSIQERFWEDLGFHLGGSEGIEKWTFAVA